MIIDAHTHLFSPKMQAKRQKLALGDPGFGAVYNNTKAKLIEVSETLGMMEKQYVDKAVVFGFPWRDLDLCREGNDYVLESMHQYPDQLIGFITLPWDGSDKVLQECERCLAAGCKGVGELALYDQPLTTESLKQLEGLAHLLAEKSAPLLLHGNEPVGHEYPGKAVIDLKALQHFIADHPRLTIILAHWGGGFFFFELMREIQEASGRVYYDTAASPFLYHRRIYDVAVAIIGEDRILFGSDYPLLPPSRYFQEMDETLLSDQVLRKIKGENARRLFGL